MPPKRSTFSRTLSNTSISSSSSSSGNKGKLKQNKLDFSFHSVSSAPRPFGSRPLSSTPSFGIPTGAGVGALESPPLPTIAGTPTLDKGKQKEQNNNGTRVGASVKQAVKGEQNTQWLWAEKLAPITGDELAVHPKKVAQVRSWLAEAFSSRPPTVKYRKVLALTGPAGAGKSATIRALASSSDLDFDILEWQNDQPSFDASNPGPSFIERFTEFLLNGAKFPKLDLQSGENDSDAPSSSSLTLDDPTTGSSERNRVILLEDLPNLHHLPTKQLFQAYIDQYIQQSAQHTSSGFQNVPIVTIVTETTPREDEDRWVGDSSTSNWKERIASIMDTRTALGEGIRRNPAYAEVRFNPVAPTIIIKGLKRAMEQMGGHVMGKIASKGMMADLLQAVADDSNGDLRAAVNCLQFVGADGGLLDAIAGKVNNAGKRGGAQEERKKKRAMRKLMPLVSGRESSLALFHALGRVLYNKREGDLNDEAPTQKRIVNSYADSDESDEGSDIDGNDSIPKHEIDSVMRSLVPSSSSEDALTELPGHMSHLFRRPSRVSVDQLWADLPVDSSVFQLYLHANFPQFCGEIEECEGILEAFSTADALLPMHDHYRHSSVAAYYSFLVSVRGTLLGLPSPVERKGQKLGKAAWWDVHKKLRAVMSDIEDVKAAHAPGLRVFGAAVGEGGEGGGARLKRVKFTNASLSTAAIDETDSAGDSYAFGAGSLIARSNSVTLVTEILPLLAKIQQKDPGKDDKVHELARMRFEYAGVADIASRQLDEHETGVLDNDEEEEEDPIAGKKKGGKRKVADSNGQHHVVSAVADEEEHLFLSDDDIGDF